VSIYPITTKPYGANAILIEWPKEVAPEILNDILQFINHLKSHCLNGTEWEFIPAYNSLTLIHRTSEVHHDEMSTTLQKWYMRKGESVLPQRFLWQIPVCYDLEFGIDLTAVAVSLGISKEEIISLHTKTPYTVYGIGFLPGFMYLGGLPKALEVDRKKVPRLKVRKGSVGLAGKQTGIYPQESPGGWNIIGSCPIPIFNRKKENPCLVTVGDQIQFFEISRAEYDLRKIENEIGIYQIKKIAIDA